MQHVIFAAIAEEGREEVPNARSKIGREAWLDTQMQFAEIWKRLDPEAQVSLQPSVYDALELAKRVGDRGKGMQTFVTGSTRLIGPALDMLEGSTPDHQAK
jgi:folylpolyglutamate synthase